MSDDDDFQPKLGKIRSGGSKAGRKYLHRILAVSNLARTGTGKAGKSRFSGARIGRGAGAGRVLASRDRHAAFRQRRVIIKSRVIKLAGKGMKGAWAHLRYIQRDGVTREGERGQLYGADRDRENGKAFLDRAEGDRHQFRFIVSPEDGAAYEDLKPLTRRLMARMEEDLGTKLDWVAVDHFNTGHPHSHIIVRGRSLSSGTAKGRNPGNDRGKDLIIARDYITTGMRERAADLVSLDLGPRTDREIENRLRQEVEQERLTSLDRRLLREMDDDRMVSASERDAFRQTLRAGRLKKLERLGLAEEVRRGAWRLDADLEDTLRRMGERGDIIKTLHREMTGKDHARSAADYAIYDPMDATTQPIVGRVMARGLSDEINDRHYLIIDAVDGRTHYIDIGQGEIAEPTPEGSIVRVSPADLEPRKADRTIAEVAAANGGRYSVDLHLSHDPRAMEDFARTHEHRLEAIRRATDGVAREPDGIWTIAPDHLDRVVAYERTRARATPVIIETLSHLPLDRQVGADGATWLDRDLISDQPTPLRDTGFGRDVREAREQRRRWLIAEGLATEDQGQTTYHRAMLTRLRKRELTRVAGQLSEELSRTYVEHHQGERVEGSLRRAVDLASGKYALIEKSREFTLVPWRPVLDRHIGKQVSGIMRSDGGISWTIGRQRGMGVG
jgi:type IV secretory pathway VirD2 relaxase